MSIICGILQRANHPRNSPRYSTVLCLLHVVWHAGILGRPSHEGYDRRYHSWYEQSTNLIWIMTDILKVSLICQIILLPARIFRPKTLLGS